MKVSVKHVAIGSAVIIASVLVALKINEKLNKAKIAPLAPAKSTTTASAPVSL